MYKTLRKLIPTPILLSALLGITPMVTTFFSPFSGVMAQNTKEINLVSGSESGVYYSIARDIEKLAEKNNLDVDVIPTRGAFQNIHDVFNYNSVGLGLTQGDIIGFFNTFANDNEDIRVKVESLRIVLPLYLEEIHLITRQDIQSVEDLEGKVVSIGDEGSGTAMTTTNLLYQWGVNPKQLVTYDVKRSIDALRGGEIDAMFYVVGSPAKVLQEQILESDNFRILPLSLTLSEDDDFLSRLYSSVTLPANTYNWQREDVQTLAVQSFLFTVEGESCENVSPVASLIKNNLPWLRENGNPIWQKVDLTSLHDRTPKKISQCVSN